MAKQKPEFDYEDLFSNDSQKEDFYERFANTTFASNWASYSERTKGHKLGRNAVIGGVSTILGYNISNFGIDLAEKNLETLKTKLEPLRQNAQNLDSIVKNLQSDIKTIQSEISKIDNLKTSAQQNSQNTTQILNDIKSFDLKNARDGLKNNIGGNIISKGFDMTNMDEMSKNLSNILNGYQSQLQNANQALEAVSGSQDILGKNITQTEKNLQTFNTIQNVSVFVALIMILTQFWHMCGIHANNKKALPGGWISFYIFLTFSLSALTQYEWNTQTLPNSEQILKFAADNYKSFEPVLNGLEKMGELVTKGLDNIGK